MEYLRYISVLRQHIGVIILMAALGAGASAFFSVRQPKVYSATATLLINPAAPAQAIPYLQASGNSMSGLQQLASTYDVYIHSPSFNTKVIQRLDLQMSPYALAAEVVTGLVGNTNFMRITVNAQSPLAAQRIANGVANTFIDQNSVLQADTVASAASADNARQLTQVKLQRDDAMAAYNSLKDSPAAKTPAGAAQLASDAASISSLTASALALQSAVTQANTPSQHLGTAQLTDPAQLPDLPISGSVTRSVVTGLILGLAIGIAIAALFEYLDYSLRTPEDVERSTKQLPLAVISMIGSRQRRGRGTVEPAATSGVASSAMRADGEAVSGVFLNGEGSWAVPDIITLQRPHDAVSEAFRALRTNLAFSTLAKPTRTLVVTSMLPSEGKSTVAANLAVVLAQSGKKIILVDADLRRPTVHQLFHISKGAGFTDLLLGDCDLATSLQQTMVPKLKILTSGTLPPNPAELLSSDAIVSLIAILSAEADMVIFDTPPMGVLTDAVVLSTRVEGSLVVVRSGSLRPNALVNGMETLRKVGAKPLGIILNMVDMAAIRGYSSASEYYYSHSESGYYGKTAKSDGHVGSLPG